MGFDHLKKVIDVSLSGNDTERTTGWKMMLESAKMAEQKGDQVMAEKLYQRCLDLTVARLGEKHVLVAHISMQFARFYETAGKMDKANPLYGKARELIAEFAQSADQSQDFG